MQFVDCVEGMPNFVDGKVPVDPQVHEALCWNELQFVKVDDDSQLCA